MPVEAMRSNIHPPNLTISLVNDDINKVDLVNRYLDMNTDPYTILVNAIKSPHTRNKYERKLKIFLDFIEIPGVDMKNRCILLGKTELEH